MLKLVKTPEDYGLDTSKHSNKSKNSSKIFTNEKK